MPWSILPATSTMNTTLLSRKKSNTITTVRIFNPTGIYSLVAMVFFAALFAIGLFFNKAIFATLLVGGFSIYGIYSLNRHDYGGWFSVVCFFCGAESILRNGLPAAYMFLFFFLVISGLLFCFNHAPSQRFKILSATGFILLLTLLHFLHLDLQELRFGIGKSGLIWAGLFFGMWISQSLKLNLQFYDFIWFYMLGAVTVLFSFLIAPQYFEGRYWPTFDGTGPVAASTGLLVLVLVQQVNTRQWVSNKNILLGFLLIMCTIALVMLGSRGTFLGLAVVTVFFLFTMRGFWNKVLISFAIVIMIGLIYYIDQSSLGNKVLSSRVEEATEENSREGRKFINSAVLLAFPEDPIFGKGTGSWRHYNNQYISAVYDRSRYPKDLIMTDAHNTTLHLLFEHGIIGVGLFLGAIFFLVRRGYSLSRYTGIFILPLVLFSFTLGLSTMHKQASMFLPFFIAMAHLSITSKKS